MTETAPIALPEPIPTPPSLRSIRDPAALREAAEAFEAMFLAEMLGHAGLGRTPEAFGGGVGEDAFGGFLVQEQAKAIAARGGIGLAENLVRALTIPEAAE
ncbi:MAG: rod-binding protein [Pseudomonadota bacterium]|nr:rod-binding protein [Pseudomonadota bacterium]MEE3101706.1 rod-binding protein [Pseudomonadota bacterium]